jgi:hypothetical protein
MKRTFAAIAVSFMFATPANASLITYDFTVTAIRGPDAGLSSTGHFTYDSNLVALNGSANGLGLFTDFAFHWLGNHFDETNMDTNVLRFGPQGELTDFLFGTNCAANGCVAGPPNTWIISMPGNFAFLYYKFPGDTFENLDSGPVTYHLRPTVPEPSSISIFLAALGLAGLAFRRKFEHGIRA